MLMKAQATRAAILSGLETLAGSTDVQSTFILYFSGHGCKLTSSDEEPYCPIPSDYDPNCFYEMPTGGSEFTLKLEAIPVQKLLVYSIAVMQVVLLLSNR